MSDMMMFFPALNMHVLVHLVVMLAWKKNSSYCYLTIYSEVVKDDATYMRKKNSAFTPTSYMSVAENQYF